MSSVHTVSMDSGISSAGNGLLHHNQLMPSVTSADHQLINSSSADHHRALDELLNDMLLTVENIPDLKQQEVSGLEEVVDAPLQQNDIPYHARHDSQPFTYGSVPAVVASIECAAANGVLTNNTNNNSMLTLSSPSLVRKASFGKGSTHTFNNHHPTTNGHHTSRHHNTLPSARSPDFHEGSIVSGSMNQHSSNNLTWLQRQQAKLRERREVALRTERLPTETRLLSELRSVLRPTPSQRFDGYTSDTTLFADEDEEDFSVPLHINTATKATANGGSSAPTSPLLPHRTSSRRGRSNTTERPFVAVKRAHEERRKYSESSSRDDSYSSWRTTSTRSEGGGGGAASPPLSSSPRPQTPAFPVHPRTPYSNNASTPTHHFETPSPHHVGLPPKSPTASRKDWSPLAETLQRELSSTSTLRGYESSSDNQHSPRSGALNGSNGQSSPSVYYGHSRRSSLHSNNEPPHDVSPAHVKFVRDTSKFWYKPTISREEAIAMLRDRPPGTFVVRDSNSFPGAFGLALKVAMPPPMHKMSSSSSSSADPSSELVRHFLIEPTSRGVRLKGCPNEPVFSSLSALVYQHSLMPLALPCQLLLPESEQSRLPSDTGTMSTAQMLLAQGAACNVLYLLTVETESLTGPQAIVRAVAELFGGTTLPTAAVVHFKVSGQGITLTDNKRQLFFRRHYPVATISFCGLDPDDHHWNQRSDLTGMPVSSNRVFGFVARKPASKTDNQCHIFAELDPEQPATAIVNFVSKVMMNSVQGKQNIV